jgi:flavin-binding protein dodecin
LHSQGWWRIIKLTAGFNIQWVHDSKRLENNMSEHTYKLIELVGSSPVSSDEAIKNAIAKASRTVKHMNWFELVETRGHIVDGKVAHFQVTIKVGFRIED